MVSNDVYKSCLATDTVSLELAIDPKLAPGEAVKRLYTKGLTPSHGRSRACGGDDLSSDDLQRAYDCGKWGATRPSDLFLRVLVLYSSLPSHESLTPQNLFFFFKIFHEVLGTLDDDIMAGVVSPPLLGSSGIIPLTIMSTLVHDNPQCRYSLLHLLTHFAALLSVADNARHMGNLIARAEKEVILCTNFWAAGEASTFISDALRELSRRAVARGERVVVKVMYDRGSVKQVSPPY
jgi:hypothetical protein